MSHSGFLKMLVPPAMVPLAVSAFVALAGPGGVIEISDNVPSASGSTDVGDDGGGESGCFLTVLRDGAASYLVLQEHVSDPVMPQGGVAGNANALDRICFGALNGSEENTTLVPGTAEDAPGKSEDAPANSDDTPATTEDAPANSDDSPATTGNAPGKSEGASGDPAASGQAEGEGQATADASGNGAADAPGHNKPPQDDKP